MRQNRHLAIRPLLALFSGLIVGGIVGVNVSSAQPPSKGTGTCSQLINGKYHQVPCAPPPPTSTALPPGPSPEEIARAERLKKASAAFKEGVLAMDRRNWADAIKKFTEALTYDPDNFAYKSNLERANNALRDAQNQEKLKTEREKAENADAAAKLASLRESLLQDSAIERLEEFNRSLAASPGDDPCPPSQDASVVDLCRREREIVEFKPPPDDSLDPNDLRIIKNMLALAQSRNWSEVEHKRLMKALYEFGPDGSRYVDTPEVTETWKNILERKVTPSLARRIRNSQGVRLSVAGKQSFNDCGVLALANATGRPYGVIAAMATRNIREGPWRADPERANPELMLKKQRGGGLLNYEIVLLAETLGQAEIVSSANFETTIQSGRPVMIGITFNNRSGHEVVLSRTFKVKGATWFEMVDSNQTGFRKLYLSQAELDKLLLEKGVAFSPEPGTTPRLLR